jgi:metal-dependent amidase/aminoacylase/carboxypeptidase family protein
VNGLKASIQVTDVYPSMINHSGLTNMVVEKARELGLEVRFLDKPFPWADDFADFQGLPIGIFGIGAGDDAPELHRSDYDFPDEILKQGSIFLWQFTSTI